MIKNYSIVILSSLILFLGCTTKENTKESLIIAAAASVQFVMQELADNFSKEQGVGIELVIGSSGKLTTQIINGAPYDLFFSSNMSYPELLFNKGKATNRPFTYGLGIPVLWSFDKSLDNGTPVSFFQMENFDHLVIANPGNAPYGEMAVKFLKKNYLFSKLESKLVYGESISQVNEYVLNRTVEVGITAKSIVLSPKLRNMGSYVELGNDYKIEQGAIVLNSEKPESLKQKFMDYLQHGKGAKLLETYGF